MQADNIIYSSDQITVPPDYGEARCISCGAKLDRLLRCSGCNAQFSKDDVGFWTKEFAIL